VLLEFAGNPVVLAIVTLALACYAVEFHLLLGSRDAQWKREARTWLGVLPILLSALPLLALCRCSACSARLQACSRRFAPWRRRTS
jgi:hypothetical protein